MTVRIDSAPVQRLEADAFTIPTDAPESDGTLEWRATTIVVVQVFAGDKVGLGYSYTHAATTSLVRGPLSAVVLSREALDVEGAYVAMQRAVRNVGRDGMAAAAVSAVDTALWDLKARLLGVPLVSLLGGVRDGVSGYGSGGFTSYSLERLCAQLAGWVSDGFPAVKMKVGRDAAADRERVRVAREAIGPAASLFADANGAYDRKQALAQAEVFRESGVNWFEEPVSSDDLEGLRLLRDRAPAGMEIAAGEYGYDVQYFRRMLEAGAVDVLQADATRCGGITGFMRVAALCDAFCLPMSAHTAPSLHVHACCAASRACNVEYFHDHARLEQMLFDGACVPDHGQLRPDRSRPGLGLELKRRDVERISV